MIVETDPIVANIIANLPGYIYWKNEKGQYIVVKIRCADWKECSLGTSFFS